MNKAVMVLCALALLTSHGRAADQTLQIGARANAESRRHSRHKMCMTHSAQMDPCSEQTIAGIKYTIAYRESSRKISYISTNGAQFRTEDGVAIGSTVDLTRDQIQAFPGWEIRGPKRSDGWRPLFGIGFLGITIVRDGKDVLIKADQTSDLLDKLFAESDITTFRIVGFVQSM
jgi:hypothetical protein